MHWIKIVSGYIIIFLFFLIFLSNSFLVYAQEPDRIITINADENKLYSYISIGGFMENCNGDEYKHRIYGQSDEINLMLELNLDQETVIGTLSGSGSDTQYSHAYESYWDFTGSISGAVYKEAFSTNYYWKISGTADITLHCIGTLRCYNSDTQLYETNTEEKNIVFSANITASSYANSKGGFGQFGIYWQDNGGLGGMSRSFSINCGPTMGSNCSLTDQLPEPINLSVSLQGPDIIDKGTNSAQFNLNPSGLDQDLVDQVWWHFYYKNPDWTPENIYEYEWKWFENHIQNDLSNLIVPSKNISHWMEIVDQYGKTIDGVKQLEFKLEVSVEDEDRNTLVNNDPINYILPNMTFNVRYDGSSLTPIDMPDFFSNFDLPNNIPGVMFQGIVTAGAGFGLIEFIRRVLGKRSGEKITKKDMELFKKRIKNLPEKSEMGSSQSEDVLELPKEDKYDIRDKKKSFLHNKIRRQKWKDDHNFEKARKQHGWTPKQEYNEMMKQYDSWIESGMKESFRRWEKSWFRRHGPGKVGNFSDAPKVIHCTWGGSRA